MGCVFDGCEERKGRCLCLMVEIVSLVDLGIFTFGFVMFRGFWLFFPQLLRCKLDERAFEVYAALGAIVKHIVNRALTLA